MNNPELEFLIKEKMYKYVPSRPVQVMHCGVIVLVSIVIGALNLSPEPLPANAGAELHPNGLKAWFGVFLAVSSLAIYFIWTSFRSAKARKEANEEFLAATSKNPEAK